jgi:glucose dehydrogenase
MKNKVLKFSLLSSFVLLLVFQTQLALRRAIAQQPSAAKKTSSFEYGGGAEGSRYSPLKQINRSNVQRLEIAWTYR